ncbi:MAG: chlorite dismutase family protein [Bacteroidota bacterium]
MNHQIFDFVGGETGLWRVLKIETVVGQPIQQVPFLNIVQSTGIPHSSNGWVLKGFRSNTRYTERLELDQLIAIQAELGRTEAICAALIPIRKTEAWWALAQDERRKIFEDQSKHTATGLKYLPAIARRLYHCRDIGEPFDFLTWFEYAPEHAEAFEELVHHLRGTAEWQYVDWEIDIRLIQTDK